MKTNESIIDYYSEKVRKYGPTPRGVDWSSEDSQRIRYRELFRVIDSPPPFSILDYGCGYGYSLTLLKDLYGDDFRYTGYDLSKEMIDHASSFHHSLPNSTFVVSLPPSPTYDYIVSSGVFNVKLNESTEEWLIYVLENLRLINALCIKGFSFNLLSIYSDEHLRKGHLYYADPLIVFDFCKKNFSSKVALLHDYPLYEFTILIKKV